MKSWPKLSSHKTPQLQNSVSLRYLPTHPKLSAKVRLFAKISITQEPFIVAHFLFKYHTCPFPDLELERKSFLLFVSRFFFWMHETTNNSPRNSYHLMCTANVLQRNSRRNSMPEEKKKKMGENRKSNFLFQTKKLFTCKCVLVL